MSETEIVVEEERISYEGIFSVQELYRLIDEWLLDKGYTKSEPKHTESAKPEGKYVEVVLEPYLELTEYAKSYIIIRMQLSEIKDVTIETSEGVKQKLNQGKVLLTISGMLETDAEGRWESKPIFMFIRTIYDKYIYKSLTGGFQKKIEDDVMQLKENISGFLNLFRYRT